MSSRWESLGGDNYTIEDLGRPAIFLLPTKKIDLVRDDLHQFLIDNFGAYTMTTLPSFGFWKNNPGATAVILDKCCEFEVSFSGKEKIPTLFKKLAEIAKIISEECIYVKAGQYSALIYPKRAIS